MIISYLRGGKKKIMLEIYSRSIMDITSLPEKACQYVFDVNVKGYMMTPKKIARAVKVIMRKTNQAKYHKVSISCLYLIN